MNEITDQQLRQFIHEEFDEVEMAMLEKQIRNSVELQTRLDQIRQSEERGEHSLGAIWRRAQITCPTREQLGSYLLKAMSADQRKYIAFHLEVIVCPYCRANFEDLEKLQAETVEKTHKRRKSIMDSTMGVLQQLQGPKG